jgi:AraC-like DNA-binding protein
MLDIYKPSEQNSDHNHLLGGNSDVYLYTEMIDKGQHTGNSPGAMHTMPSKAFDEVVTELGLTAEGILTAPAVEVDNLEEGLALFTFTNQQKTPTTLSFATEQPMMYFFFTLTGKVVLGESINNSSKEIDNNSFRFFAYPRAQATLSLYLEPNAKSLLMLISLKKLHEFFMPGPNMADRTSFETLSKSMRSGDPAIQGVLSPSMSVVVSQLTGSQINQSFRQLYRKGKVLEFFSLYLDQSKRSSITAAECPYVANDMDIDRIHNVRELLEKDMANPPSLVEIAKITGLNEFKLKVGFKQVYGNTVYGYLNDLRMETARKMLEDRKHQVKEIGFSIGYNNASHFISAFKKKFGVTPNKYMEG